jgi:hypothetical protein
MSFEFFHFFSFQNSFLFLSIALSKIACFAARMADAPSVAATDTVVDAAAPHPTAAAAAAPAQHHQLSPAKSKACVCCDVPVALYGRLLPCAHAFCLVCSSSMTTCYM